MRGWCLHQLGWAGLRLETLPPPIPGPDEVVLKVHAAALNPADLLILQGLLGPANPDLPAVLGMDVAGEIVACGEAVAGWQVGDAVYACAGGVKGRAGTLAEFTLADARSLAHKPATLSMREAAALPLVSITAWDGLLDRAQLAAGETVLIQAGSGGVGYIAAQLAKSAHARVFATASTTAKQNLLQEIGVIPIAYRELAPADIVQQFTAGKGFDVVYDCAGESALEASLAVVRRYGRVVSCAAWGAANLAPLLGQSASLIGIFMLLPLLTGEGLQRHGEILAEVAKRVDAGQLKPLLDPMRFGLEQADTALQRLAAGQHSGKLVIDVLA